jgi:hypothetical protein
MPDGTLATCLYDGTTLTTTRDERRDELAQARVHRVRVLAHLSAFGLQRLPTTRPGRSPVRTGHERAIGLPPAFGLAPAARARGDAHCAAAREQGQL